MAPHRVYALSMRDFRGSLISFLLFTSVAGCGAEHTRGAEGIGSETRPPTTASQPTEGVAAVTQSDNQSPLGQLPMAEGASVQPGEESADDPTVTHDAEYTATAQSSDNGRRPTSVDGTPADPGQPTDAQEPAQPVAPGQAPQPAPAGLPGVRLAELRPEGGGLSLAAARGALDAQRDAMGGCYSRSLAGRQRYAEQSTVEMTVQTDGTVSDAYASGGEDLSDCLNGLLARTPFPAPRRTTTLRFRIHFTAPR